MSLLPDQVTANNFKDFYDKIKPYLNYQPTMGFTPVGTVISIMGTHAPAHYLICDGTVYNIADHLELANYFDEQFGSANFFGGDGTTTFAVPDLRGEFLRGAGTNSHTDQGSGANVGVHQDATGHPAIGYSYESNDDYLAFPHEGTSTWAGYRAADSTLGGGTTAWVSKTGSNANARVSYYTARPTNTSVLYCIAEKNIFIQVLGGGSGTGDMFTSDYAKLGVTDTVDKAVNLYDGTNTLTSTIPELNKLHGATITTSELNYVHGVTSDIQTQLNGKSAVTWTQSVSTGTKIATVNIDGTPTDIYAPSATPGTTNYSDLTNKPSINGNELTGNKTAAQLGIANQTLASGGTDLTARAKVNFTDFDVSDNTSNNRTEVKAHELTSAEVTEILSNLPAANTNLMPVLFDESGSERAVGWYKLADGTKKPVYQKELMGTSGTTVNTAVSVGNIANIDSVMSLFGILTRADGTKDNIGDPNSGITVSNNGDVNIYVEVSAFVNCPVAICVQYTKTTDNPV